MKVHELKTIQPYFDMVANGSKKFELRKNDRGFKIYDILILHEYHPNNNVSLASLAVRVTGVLENFPGIETGYCILSISDPI